MLFALKKKDGNNIFIIDELDRSLHTKLSTNLIDEFINQSAGTNNQLIFTAHDINIMSDKYMSQEEIWFIEKNRLGETTLRPLSHFDTNGGYDTVKAYVDGRFGAVPVFRFVTSPAKEAEG
jgi:AAA15 family ATPase/GTPase